MVECNVMNAYDSSSFLSDAVCVEVEQHSIAWPYFILRYLGDLFAICVHLLVNVAVIVATRETSTGRGNVGHQLVFAALGILIISALLFFLHISIGAFDFLAEWFGTGMDNLPHQLVIGLCCILLVTAACIVICAK